MRTLADPDPPGTLTEVRSKKRGEVPLQVDRARQGVAVVFGTAGLAFASLASRAPAVQQGLGLRPSGFGLLLLALSAGSMLALPLAGPLVHRYTPRPVVQVAAVVLAVGLTAAAVGVSISSVFVTGAGLFGTGLGMSTWDVAMNVEATYVERRSGRTLMPRFHAGFSLGTVAGALLGSAAAGLGIGVTAQLVFTAVLASALVPLGLRHFLLPVVTPQSTGSRAGTAFAAWREPRTLAVGVLVLAFAFTEGSANDWMAISFVDGHGTSGAVGAAGLGVFLAAMTTGRFLGGGLIDLWGRVPVLAGSAVVAAGGLLLVTHGGSLPFAFLGALLWGTGAALGFPTGMSAAGDDPARAAGRVGVVSSIGYSAFLAGPPLIGFLADERGILGALAVVAVALLVALVVSPAARPTPQREGQADS